MHPVVRSSGVYPQMEMRELRMAFKDRESPFFPAILSLRECVHDAVHRNNVKVLGTGEQTIMFADGYGCDQSMWRHVYPAFADKYRIVLFDYVGSGQSDVTEFSSSRYSTLRGYGLDILDIWTS